MSLQDWHRFGWLKPHETSFEEQSNLLAIADRDISDAESVALSADWRFGIAYNAALKLCTMMLYDAGFMPAEVKKTDPVSRLPYLVRVSRRIDIKKSAESSSATVRKCPVGIYTIVEERNGYGKLKSGAGWVHLDDVRKI